MDIKRLAQKIEAAQSILDEIRRDSGCDAFATKYSTTKGRQETALETAERAYKERRERAKHFNSQQIFGEPAWDILLDLYIHQARDEQVTVKSALVGSGTTATTAQRWLNVLDSEGLISSEVDPADSFKYFLRLTAEGYESITRYLEAISR
jgi:DNA-binding MarR family transcriptional regulator